MLFSFYFFYIYIFLNSFLTSQILDKNSFITKYYKINKFKLFQEYFQLGINSYYNKNYSLAHKYYNYILLLYPNHFDVLYNKGVVYHSNNDVINAIKYYELTLFYNQYDMRARLNLAAINQIRNNLTASIELYKFVFIFIY